MMNLNALLYIGVAMPKAGPMPTGDYSVLSYFLSLVTLVEV